MWPGSTAAASRGAADRRDAPDDATAFAGDGPRPLRTTWDAAAVRSVVEAAVATVGADAGVVAYVSGRRLVRLASVGFGADAFTAWPLALNGEGPLVEAVTAAHSVWVADAAELAERYPTLLPRQTAATGGFVPVVVNGRTVGALGVTFAGQHTWTPEEMARLERVATGLEAPLRRWAMAERRRAAREELDALRAEPSAQARLDRAARLVAESLGGDTVLLSVVSEDGDWLDRFGVFHVDGGAEVELRRILANRIRVGENRSSAVIVNNEPIVVPTIDPALYIEQAPPRFRSFFEQWPAHGTLAFPVRGRDGRPVAGLVAVRHRPNEAYDETDRRWMAEAAAALSDVIDAPAPTVGAEARRLVPLAGSNWGLALGVALPAALSAILAIPTDSSGFRPSALLLAGVVAVAVLAGRRAAVLAAASTMAALLWIVLPPRFGIELTATNSIAVAVYAISCLLVIALVGRLERATTALVSLERDAAVARQQEMRERLVAAERQSVADSRFRSLVEATTSVTWRSDAQGQLTEPQPSWESYTGQPWSEQMGSGWGDMVHADDTAAVAKAWGEALAQGTGFEVPFRLWSIRHGEHRHAVARAVPLRDRNGDVVEWVGTVTDVHDQHVLLRELDVTRAQLEALMDADVLAFFFGEDDRITQANEAFLTLTGYSQDDLDAGRLSWRALTPPGWEEADRYALDQLVRNGRCDPFEKEYIRADGRRVPVELGVVALEREPLRWVGYVVDLTERKATEQVQLDTGFLLHGADTNLLGDMDALLDKLRRGEITREEIDRLLGELTAGKAGGFGPMPTVKGWGGDRFVLYRPASGGVCLRVDWRMDSVTAREDMLRALQEWSGKDPTVQLAQPDAELLRASRCAPAA